MDTSETYIKMCDCEEIQSLFQITGYGISSENPEMTYGGDYIGNGLDNKIIWLPRQDQLQEMVFIPYKAEHADLQNRMLCEQLALLARQFSNFVTEESLSDFTSMEQLWLAFVMKENNNKVWNGDKWEVERDG